MPAIADRMQPGSPRDRRYVVRPHLFLQPHERILCPNGHVVRSNAGVIEHDTLICQERINKGAAECGLRVYVRRMPDGRHYVAQISPAEMVHMRNANMNADEALAYLSTPPRSAA
jgi:hypothetical protein